MSNNKSIYCSVCDVSVKSKSFSSHLRSTVHKNNNSVKKCEGIEKVSGAFRNRIASYRVSGISDSDDVGVSCPPETFLHSLRRRVHQLIDARLDSFISLKVCLPSLVLSFGTLLVHAVGCGQTLWLGLYTPSIFLSTFYLSQCWCRDAADSWGGITGHRLMASTGLLLVVASLLLCAFVPYQFQPFIYGGLGGLGSSLISAQVDAVVFDTYDSRLRIVRSVCFVGQAVGQAVFPHIITSLVDDYGYPKCYILLSAIMLQMLPVLMLLKVNESVKQPVEYSRYSDLAKSYAIFDNDHVEGFYTNELQLHDLSKSWKSPVSQTGEEEIDYDGDVDSVNLTTSTPPPSPEEKRRNVFGVEILPEIPEESEESDIEIDFNKNRMKFNHAIKRLSILGDNFDDFIVKQIRRDSITDNNSTTEYSEVDVTYETIAPMTEIRHEKVFNSFSFRCQSAFVSMRRKFWMPSYRVYRLQRRLLYVMYVINDTFIKPLSRSLSCWKFYPALLLSFARLLLMAMMLAILPMISFDMKPKTPMIETNFMISLHGFMWLSFLVITPWLAQTSKSNFKYIVVIGLFISTAACYCEYFSLGTYIPRNISTISMYFPCIVTVIAEAKNHDMFSIGCVIAGLGFGAVTACWEPAVQDFVGAHKWSKVHSSLETLSGIFLAAFVYGLSFVISLEDGGLNLCMLALSYALAVVSVVWFTISMVSVYLIKMRSFRIKRNWLL